MKPARTTSGGERQLAVSRRLDGGLGEAELPPVERGQLAVRTIAFPALRAGKWRSRLGDDCLSCKVQLAAPSYSPVGDAGP